MTVVAADPAAEQITEDVTPDGRENVILRPEPATTLADVVEDWSGRATTTTVHIDKVNVHLEEANPSISIGDVEVPVSPGGLEVLARHLGMPVKYLLSCPQDEQQFMLTHRLNRAKDERPTFAYNDTLGLTEIREEGRFYVDPERIVDNVAAVLPVDSPVRDYWADANELRLDVYTLDEHDAMARYTGGDRAVGDITRGGVRIVQNRKENRMPEVETYLYRLWCTNGMEAPPETAAMRLDGRRSDIQEVFDIEFRAIVEHSLANIESSIDAFYDLRNQPLGDDPTGTLHRMGRDAGLSNLVVGRLEDRLAAIANPTMFDAVNMITNAANSAPRARAARTMQRAAGLVAADHRARCNACHSVLI